jgi:hypothetical protein
LFHRAEKFSDTPAKKATPTNEGCLLKVEKMKGKSTLQHW